MSAVMISVADAGRNLSKLVSTAEAGNDVIITRRGQPTARVTAMGTTAAGVGNGHRAVAVLAERLARRKHWATPAQVEATIAAVGDGWNE